MCFIHGKNYQIRMKFYQIKIKAIKKHDHAITLHELEPLPPLPPAIVFVTFAYTKVYAGGRSLLEAP